MDAYSIIKGIHNVVRWVVIIAALVAVVRGYRGWLGKKDWTKLDRLVGTIFASSIDTQMLLGIIMVVMAGGFTPFPTITRDHIIPMVVGVIIVHVANMLIRRPESDVLKHRRAALWYTATLIVILVAIPWTRPLLPGM